MLVQRSRKGKKSIHDPMLQSCYLFVDVCTERVDENGMSKEDRVSNRTMPQDDCQSK